MVDPEPKVPLTLEVICSVWLRLCEERQQNYINYQIYPQKTNKLAPRYTLF